MSLTNNEKARALKWFASKNGERGCPVCGDSSWKVETDAALRGAKRLGDIHVIVIGCLNCGHLLLFNTNIAILEPDDEKDEATED